jgi:hypothetical protein
MVVDALVEASGLTVRPPERTTLLTSRHCLDALIAALTGHEYLNGNTFDPPDYVSEDEFEVEGWIRVPTATLGRLRT